MKLFSTMSLEAPVREKSMARKVMTYIIFLSCSTMFEESLTKEKVCAFFFLGGVFLSNISTVGKMIKEMTKESTIPADIIQPKLMMGCMYENRRDENPAIVVKMAKNVGVDLESMVKSMVRFFEARGYLLVSSSCLTMRCKTMEIVMISCKAIKFEEIIVISQPQ